MKAATLPAVRVDTQLRNDLDRVLVEGETASSFIEQAVRGAIESRRVRADFAARGQRAWEAFQATGASVDVDSAFDAVHAKLRARQAQLDGKPS